jgi:hypothetical protein
LAVAAVAVLVVLAVPPSVRVNGPLPTGGMTAFEVRQLFDDYGDAGGNWTGADSTASVRLPDGRVAWLFSDTFLGTVEADHSRPRSSPFINNSIVVQEGTALTDTKHGGSATVPRALVPAAAGEVYWVGDGVVEHGALRVLYNRYRKTGPGVLDVALAGTSLVTFDLPAITVRNVRELPLDDRIAWGSAILEDDAFTYVYGSEAAGFGLRFAHVARVPNGGLGGAWEFWTGTGWSAAQVDSARLLSGVGTAFAVQKVGADYVLVTQQSNLLFDPAMVAYRSASPTGPFDGPAHLLTAPEQRAGESTIVYDARLHPDLARPGKLLMSYNVNSLEPDDVYADARIYRPRFAEFDWPRPVPDPAAVPGSPAELSASMDRDVVRLSWTASSGTARCYRVHQRDVTAGQTHFARLNSQFTRTTAQVSAVRDGHRYEYRVTAENTAGEGKPSAVAAIDAVVPPEAATVPASVLTWPPSTPTSVSPAPVPPPADLKAVAKDDGSIVLSWTSSGDGMRYVVHGRDVTAGEVGFTRWEKPITEGTTAATGPLTHGHVYEYQVTSMNQAGESSPSNTVTATSRYQVPATPRNLRLAAVDGQVRLDWDASDTATGYWVYSRDVTAGQQDFVRGGHPVSGDTMLTVGPLDIEHVHEFKVTAFNNGGESTPTPVVRTTPKAPKPGAPTGLVAASQTDGTIKLAWTAPGPDLWYLVSVRDATANRPWERLPLPITDGTSFTAGSLAHDHNYEFTVTATNASGEGPPSAVASAVAKYPQPPAPPSVTTTTEPPPPVAAPLEGCGNG